MESPDCHYDERLFCPEEVPAGGSPCDCAEMFCMYLRGGPCPPDPDQLRQCIDGKWVVTAPASDCWNRSDEDAGAP